MSLLLQKLKINENKIDSINFTSHSKDKQMKENSTIDQSAGKTENLKLFTKGIYALAIKLFFFINCSQRFKFLLHPYKRLDLVLLNSAAEEDCRAIDCFVSYSFL